MKAGIMKWISVEDKLPKENHFVICATVNKNVWVFQLSCCDIDEANPTGKLWYPPSDYSEPCHFAEITHWMELPEFPSKNIISKSLGLSLTGISIAPREDVPDNFMFVNPKLYERLKS